MRKCCEKWAELSGCCSGFKDSYGNKTEEQHTNQANNSSKKPHYLKDHMSKKSWAHRNPRAYFVIFSTTCLLILYSRPLYDIFLREDPPLSPIKK
ncbi:hypothetical protein B566_EDAN015863 [Ephemera danica]|nr:hypothetical protein B566_EDAN015863 [Ephemera danica]